MEEKEICQTIYDNNASSEQNVIFNKNMTDLIEKYMKYDKATLAIKLACRDILNNKK